MHAEIKQACTCGATAERLNDARTHQNATSSAVQEMKSQTSSMLLSEIRAFLPPPRHFQKTPASAIFARKVFRCRRALVRHMSAFHDCIGLSPACAPFRATARSFPRLRACGPSARNGGRQRLRAHDRAAFRAAQQNARPRAPPRQGRG